MRYVFALLAGKLARLGSRILGRVMKKAGTNLPGKVALKIDPMFIAHVRKPKTIIAVTGTNGKTTTTNMIADILTRHGEKVLSNRLGSNINSGVATALLNGVDLFGKEQYPVAVLETDERSAFLIQPYLKPDYLVVTNLLRDSMRRNAHPHYIFDILDSAVPDGTKMILNADDIISADLKKNNPRVYYAIDKQPGDLDHPINLVNDMRFCPRCQGPLSYVYARYNHIGKAYCPACGFSAPKADYNAVTLDYQTMEMKLSAPQGTETYHMVNDSIFNLYDEIAAIALAREYGISADQLAAYLKDITIIDSRHHEEDFGGIRFVANMSKGQISTSTTVGIAYAAGLPGKKQIILMIDDIQDQKVSCENTAYESDVDFEQLRDDSITSVILLGPRNKDLYLRCLLAGIPREKLHKADTQQEAVSLLQFEKGTTIMLLHDSYSISEKEELTRQIREAALSQAKGGEKFA